MTSERFLEDGALLDWVILRSLVVLFLFVVLVQVDAFSPMAQRSLVPLIHINLHKLQVGVPRRPLRHRIQPHHIRIIQILLVFNSHNGAKYLRLPLVLVVQINVVCGLLGLFGNVNCTLIHIYRLDSIVNLFEI